ncbi:MAG: acyl-CoA dehydratase activase [Candidatus Kariarchaeaceae archaeon]|jgi:predicted CoA-substrate-specific enzyme activase
MFCLGVDIGSITAKAVILDTETREIKGWDLLLSGYDTKETAKQLVDNLLQKLGIDLSEIDYTISTGYSRKNVDFSSQQITEISCQARGIHHLFPSAHTVIDIGGQDSKVIQIDDQGNLSDFEMNDKCSAGTGRFLEVMAQSLQVPLDEMAQLSSQAKEHVSISSTCTVFAESEVVSRIAQGAKREEIIGGIHQSIATKVHSLVGRVGIKPDVVITGGVAKNQAVVDTLQEKMGCIVKVPTEPQITGALGAALIAIEKYQKQAITT